MTSAHPAVQTWLTQFAEAVRSGDTSRGAPLFAPQSRGFGTVTSSYDNRDELIDQQWSQVWQRTHDFAFDPPLAVWQSGDTMTVAVTWSSRRMKTHELRRGRATFHLVPDQHGVLVAVHSHFSMEPGTAA